MAEKRCFNCMRLYSGAFCPKCGAPRELENAHHQLRAGTVLQERYLIGRVLGQGGFGITYLGYDQQEEQIIAVKEYYPSTVVNRNHLESLTVRVNIPSLEKGYSSGKERFFREAKALSSLKDVPQIVQIHDCFQSHNTAYIVMEYVRGMDLGSYVRRMGGSMDPEQTLRILKPVIQALSKVHEAGLIHRDISPDNIILHPTAGAKLLDFGASRTVERPDTDKELPRSTESILKHGYAPVEQYRSRGSLGPWTDVYALCATIYHCITGRIPPDALSRAFEDAELDWSGVTLKKELRDALEMGLAVQAKDRYPTMQALYEALYPLSSKTSADGDPEITPEPRPIPPVKKKKAGLFIGIGIAAVLALAGITLLLIPKQSSPGIREHVSGRETEPDPLVQVTETLETQAAAVQSGRWESNILMEYPLSALPIEKLDIQSVVFLSTLADAPDTAVDVSDGPGTVLGWVEEGGNVFFAAEGGINGRDACRGLFAGCENMHTVRFGDAFHTSQARSMEEMFFTCFQLRQVDTENLDTGRVMSMAYMFAMKRRDNSGMYVTDDSVYSHLETVNVSGWDVSNVIDMSDMFYECRNLETLDVSRWDVGNVGSFRRMFCYCPNLRELKVDNWDVSSCKNFSAFFLGCSSLKELEVGNWDVSNATEMVSMFNDCSDLQSLNVGSWDMSRVELTRYMFFGCSELRSLNAEDWDLSAVTDVGNMFYGCYRLTGLDWSGWDVSQVTNSKDFYHEDNFCGIPWKDAFGS